MAHRWVSAVREPLSLYLQRSLHFRQAGFQLSNLLLESFALLYELCSALLLHLALQDSSSIG